MKLYGHCQSCGKKYLLTKYGYVRQHSRTFHESQMGVHCYGSGKSPTEATAAALGEKARLR